MATEKVTLHEQVSRLTHGLPMITLDLRKPAGVSMVEGASIRISPTWLPGDVIICDISWETDDLVTMVVPQGQWTGQFALLGGFGTQIGQWDWYSNTLELELWVPNPLDPTIRHLIATLHSFTMPARDGDLGTGTLQPTLAPTTGTLDFDWEIAAII